MARWGLSEGARCVTSSVEEELPPATAGKFPELTICNGAGGPSLYGPVADQSALMGLLARFDNLGVAITEIRRLPD